MRRPMFLLAAMLIAGATVADEREYIYGAELMKPGERDAYRRELQKAPDDEAREAYRQRHRERLRERARQRGMTLDEKGIVRGREDRR